MQALACSGGVDNVLLLDKDKFKPLTQGVASAGVPVSNDFKWKVGEAELESLMRMLDNLVSESFRRAYLIPPNGRFHLYSCATTDGQPRQLSGLQLRGAVRPPFAGVGTR